MRPLLALSAALLVVATSTAMSAAEERRPTSRDRDQLICKSEPRTGSRFGRRTCTTKAERERLVTDQQRKAGEIIDRPIICVGKEGC